MIGTRLGPYEITAKLGEGGMGEVYRATDSKLKRQVAIKVLPAAFTEDKERLARFEREAQLLAQLHHPHIASIFGLEESDGVRALVMELVEGDDLSTLIANGPLPVAEALVFARQTAGALEAAHEQGIIHRDLKPQNIKLARDGTVKVLDFGLAKAMEPPGSSSAADLARSPTLMNSPTLTGMHGTQLGVILGSAAYMAPEQAKGMAVDKRADIWAFGVVLYEMLTGGSLFAGDSVGDTLAAVIRADIDLGRLPAETPSAIRQLLRRCLERNPKNRLHDIADARIMLDEVLSGPSEPATAAPASAPETRARPWLAYLLGALGLGIGLVAIALPWLRGGSGAAAPASLRLEIASPEDTALLSGLALSPDGATLAFVARRKEGRSELWVRRLDSLQARALPGTADARYPFWSPDGKRIGFFAEGRLKVTDLVGTPRILATTAATTDARGGSWGADDTILYAPSFVGGLNRVSARGGEPVAALEIPADSDLGTLRFPHFLPDGRRFVFYGSPGSGSEPGQLFLGELDSPVMKLLTEANSMAVFAPPDRMLFVRGEALVAQRLDLENGTLIGEAEPLGLRLPGGFAVSSQRSLSVSRTGILVARQDKRGVTHPVWVDRQGRELEEIAGGGKIWWYAPRISPDGRKMAIARYDAGGGDVWIHDFERRLASRFTFSEGDDQVAVWSPDGRTLVYSSTRAGRPVGLYLAATDRPGQERLWHESSGFLWPSAFTADGRQLIFERSDENGQNSLFIGPVEGLSEPRRLFSDTGAEWAADVSPDGRWIAYASDMTRRAEVYVRKLDGTDNPLRVSTEGGGQPFWRRDGRELFYVDDSGRLVALAVEPGDPPRFSAPSQLFDGQLEDAVDRQFDASADGQRFFVNRRAAGGLEPILVLIGWDRKGANEPEPQP